jgi:hypothetical protein
VLTLLGVSIVSGIAWFESPPRTSGEVTIQQRPAIGAATEPSTSMAASSIDTTSPQTMAEPQSRPRNTSTTTRGDEISIGEREKALPDVVAAADDALNMLRTRFYTVRGHLRSRQGQPDEGLRGLITTDLTLDVTLVDTQGVVHDAFTITSRGGGFTSDASALQARERLRDALHERLQKEHQ